MNFFLNNRHSFCHTLFFLFIMFLSVTAWSQDYRKFSDTELIEMIGTMHNASPEDRVAFRNEMATRFDHKNMNTLQETNKGSDEINLLDRNMGNNKNMENSNSQRRGNHSGGGC